MTRQPLKISWTYSSPPKSDCTLKSPQGALSLRFFPMNFLIVESLQKFDFYYGPDFKVECPTRSGVLLTLGEVATELSQRLSSIFLLQEDGTRPVQGCMPQVADDPLWKDLLLFFEYFNGDNGAGVGASHQTGWTALVAKLLQQSGNRHARVPQHQDVEKPVAAAATEEKARELRQQDDSDS